jgi:tetratricopeptide (TPR) repeat protein
VQYFVQTLVPSLNTLTPLLESKFPASLVSFILGYLCPDQDFWNPQKTWALLLDADMMLVLGEKIRTSSQIKGWKNKLNHFGYELKQVNQNLTYYNVRLLQVSEAWECRGATHEFWICPPYSQVRVKRLQDHPWLDDRNDGGCKADKFQRDILLLEDAIQKFPHDSRNYYYLAQTYGNLGDYKRAFEFYRKRANFTKLFGPEIFEVNPEEKWHAKYMMGRACVAMKNWGKAQIYFWQAFEERPHRLEPLYELIRGFRIRAQYQAANILLARAKTLSYPTQDSLFVAHDIYHYLLIYEMSLISFYVKEEKQGWEACEKLRLLSVPVPHQ